MRDLQAKLSLNLANALYASAGHSGGGALNKSFKRPATGYLVKINPLVEYPNLSTVNEHVLAKEIGEWMESTPSEDTYYVASVDEKSGAVKFDVYVNVQDKEEAAMMAEELGETTIWDLEKQEDVSCE